MIGYYDIGSRTIYYTFEPYKLDHIYPRRNTNEVIRQCPSYSTLAIL